MGAMISGLLGGDTGGTGSIDSNNRLDGGTGGTAATRRLSNMQNPKRDSDG